MEDLLDLLHQTLLLTVTSLGMTSLTLCLSDGVLVGSTLSTSQGRVTAGTIGVSLEVGIVIVVGTLAGSAGVGSEILVGCTELAVSNAPLRRVK
jgi:hypothetical protein